jgi:LPXTG-motif cell wall-anchored protein
VLLPGTYTAKIALHFGDTNQKATATVKFYSEGMFDFPLIGIGLIIGLLILLYLRKRLKKKS